MKLKELNEIQKLYFGHEEIARALGITRSSARVAASRYIRQGLLVRVKKNVYILRETWKGMSREEVFQIANIGQVPSYISLMTALDYYGATTQVQRDFVESIAQKRSKEILVEGTVLNYTKIAESLYYGFQKERGFFIASPEKAFLDALYLMSLGRYSLDLSSIEPNRFEQERVLSLSQTFPMRTRKLLRSYEYPAAT